MNLECTTGKKRDIPVREQQTGRVKERKWGKGWKMRLNVGSREAHLRFRENMRRLWKFSKSSDGWRENAG